MNLGDVRLDFDDILPGLIWAVILIIWAVGKLLTAMRGKDKKSAPQQEQAEGAGEAKNELRDFLETLTGQKFEPEPEPEPEPRYVPPPLTAAQANVRSSFTYRAPAPKPVMKEVPEVPMTVFRPAQLRGTDSMLVALRSMRLPGGSLPKADLWTPANKHFPAELSRPADLRRAMVQRIVLGPPVALGGKASSPDLPEY